MINFIIWIIAGAVIGWVASLIMRTNKRQGLIADIVVGIVGAFLAGYFLSPAFLQPATHLAKQPPWKRLAVRTPMQLTRCRSGV